MLLDDFLKKHQLKEDFIKKIKVATDSSFKTDYFLIASDKIKYVGNFYQNSMEFREKESGFGFKTYQVKTFINLSFKNVNDLLSVKTTIQGISYFRFLINITIMSLLLIYCFLLLLKLNILPVLLILSLIYFYLFLAFKKIKANLKKIKKELSDLYRSME
ncbi:hypothetical protein FIA58_019815 [Flavobacterium jejuense]|uniref:Uncharacterized protein n=1 Tax=Flavobacterium jejuense TaxID=1544455 RepID=A0ABX0IXP7_9FLAO|nr:hypothetical protein [Flavobacterium jejuense]NHN27931.1 hypothetical protein [Flavobacterium jejuense]